MKLNVQSDFLDESNRSAILDWITTNEHLDSFGSSRQAFNATYKDKDLPTFLQPFKCAGCNAYHFVGIITHELGAIDEHVDEELVHYFLEEKHRPIRYPDTVVYYVDIDEEMVGGELIVDNIPVPPKSNLAISFPSKTSHSVNAISQSGRPRIVLVCEQYKLLNINYIALETPMLRRG